MDSANDAHVIPCLNQTSAADGTARVIINLYRICIVLIILIKYRIK
jgi:hypothetical protein